MYIMLLKAIVLTVLFFLCYMYQSTKKIGLLSDLKKTISLHFAITSIRIMEKTAIFL